jgi:hypothetical protein
MIGKDVYQVVVVVVVVLCVWKVEISYVDMDGPQECLVLLQRMDDSKPMMQ